MSASKVHVSCTIHVNTRTHLGLEHIIVRIVKQSNGLVIITFWLSLFIHFPKNFISVNSFLSAVQSHSSLNVHFLEQRSTLTCFVSLVLEAQKSEAIVFIVISSSYNNDIAHPLYC